MQKHLKLQPKHKIMMVHPGRCGSTVIGNLLKQHFNIFWAEEIYTPSQEWVKNNPATTFADFTKEQNISERAMEILTNSVNSTDRPYYQFTVKPMQFNVFNCSFTDYVEQVCRAGFEYFIMLVRKNILRIVVSIDIGMQTQRWHINKAENTELLKVNIRSDNILERVSRRARELREIEKALMGRNVLKLNYEDDIENDPKKAYLRVCDFIGIKPQKVVVDLFKTNPFPLPDIIINFAEIERTLKNTAYEWMLYK